MSEETITAAVRFDIFTRQWNDERREWEPSALKAIKGDDGKMRLLGTASSTIKDLHGDNMLLSALEDMEKAANNNLTIFGNHSYQVPEDVYGSTESASIRNAGTVDENGDPIYDLKFSIVMNDENDRAVKTWKAIDKGSKLGISIGANIPAGGAVRDKKSGAYTIAHVDLLETSIVGIPANPRSWVENAMKSLSVPAQKAATTVPIGQPTLTLDTDAGTYSIEGRLDGVHLSAEDVEVTISTESEIVEADGQPEITDAACPDCGHGKADGGDCHNAFHKDTEPDVTDAKIRVIEIDTGDDSGGSSSQEASSSEPAPTELVGEDDAAGTEEVIASADEIITTVETAMTSLEPEVTTMLQQLMDLTTSLNRELAASLTREQEAMAAKAQVERQRDEIVVLSGKLISGTNAILNKLADQPVGRRTVYREAQEQFDGLEGLYTREFLTLLRSKNT